MTPEEVAERIIPRFQILLPEDAGGYRCEIAAAIREAVAVKGEECAKLAESLIDCTVPPDRYDLAYTQGRNDAAIRIAKHIREGGGT